MGVSAQYNPKALVVLKNFGESPHRHLELVEKLNTDFGIGGLHGDAWHINLSYGVRVHRHDIVGWDGFIPGHMLNEYMDGTFPLSAIEEPLPLPPAIIPPPPVPVDVPPPAAVIMAPPRFIKPKVATRPKYDYEEIDGGFKCLWPGCGKVLKSEKGMKNHVAKMHG